MFGIERRSESAGVRIAEFAAPLQGLQEGAFRSPRPLAWAMLRRPFGPELRRNKELRTAAGAYVRSIINTPPMRLDASFFSGD